MLHSPQAIYGTLKAADYLQERETEQLFSEALGKFLADRFVCGTCPKCGYEVPSITNKSKTLLLSTALQN